MAEVVLDMSGGRHQQEESLGMPGSRAQHGVALDDENLGRLGTSVSHGAVVKVQPVVGEQYDVGHDRLHLSEQYFTDSQSRAQALRHSIGRPQAWQGLGAKPFFVRACLEAGWRSGTPESRISHEGSHP